MDVDDCKVCLLLLMIGNDIFVFINVKVWLV